MSWRLNTSARSSRCQGPVDGTLRVRFALMMQCFSISIGTLQVLRPPSLTSNYSLSLHYRNSTCGFQYLPPPSREPSEQQHHQSSQLSAFFSSHRPRRLAIWLQVSSRQLSYLALVLISQAPSDLNIENTNIKTASGVSLDDNQKTLVGSVLDVSIFPSIILSHCIR